MTSAVVQEAAPDVAGDIARCRLCRDRFAATATRHAPRPVVCFPGYDRAGSDLPPPRICAKTWRERALASVGDVPLTLLIGGYAQSWHLGGRASVTDRVAAWRDHAPRVFALPHPSWRNTAWLKRNPWFEEEVVPWLRARVRSLVS